MKGPALVLVKRLVGLYDPVEALAAGADTDLAQLLYRAVHEGRVFQPAEPEFIEGFVERSDEWHLGRVRYFCDILERGGKIDPIEVDNYCVGGYIEPEPIVLDGHHRLIAHMVARAERIPVDYSGRVDLRKYLTGEKKNRPRA